MGCDNVALSGSPERVLLCLGSSVGDFLHTHHTTLAQELQTILHSHGVAPGHKSAADQRDEVISLLSRKVQETSDLFESLEMRMNDRERELDNVRHDLHDCEDDLRRAEQEIDRVWQLLSLPSPFSYHHPTATFKQQRPPRN